jgi:hypothetical protein
MALKLNKTLSTQSGLTLPVNNVITSALHFPFVIVNVDEDGNPDGTYTRRITYDLRNYVADADVIKAGDNYVKGGVTEFPTGYEKVMTDQEYADLLADGSLAEVWLQEYIDGIMGAGTATIFDPYA